MKKIIFLFIVAINAHTYAQDDASAFKRVQIGVNFSPDIAYRTLKETDDNFFNNLIYNNRKNTEVVKFGYTGGFNFCYNLKKSFGLEIGLQLSDKGYQTKTQNLIWPQTTVNQPTSFKEIYNFYYLDIPVKANFSLGKKKLRFFGSIGLATNIFLALGQTSVETYADGKTTRNAQGNSNNNVNKVGLSPLVSLGVEYHINSKTSLRIDPTFRYNVLKTYDSAVTDHLWSCGLNIGYYFGL